LPGPIRSDFTPNWVAVTSNESIPGLAALATIGIVAGSDVTPGGNVIVLSTGWYCTPGFAEGIGAEDCTSGNPHKVAGTSCCAEGPGVEEVGIGPVATSTWIEWYGLLL
jgi:hypothetical protein